MVERRSPKPWAEVRFLYTVHSPDVMAGAGSARYSATPARKIGAELADLRLPKAKTSRPRVSP
jgi:hypothetical protein